MSEQSQGLQKLEGQAPGRPRNKVGFHNQANQKALGRSQMLEALTANKGGALGKRGLIFKVMASLDRDLDSPDPEIYQPARAEALKMALAMTKDDKAHDSLSDLLKSGSNVQINFNSYFQGRSEADRQGQAGQGLTIESQSSGVSIGFTPAPGSRGQAGLDEAGGG